MGETVLERNICFIDTPGSSPTWTEEHVVRYVESLLHKNASITALSESELMNALSGSGGVQVDVVIYVLPHGKSSLSNMAVKSLTPEKSGHAMSTSLILVVWQA